MRWSATGWRGTLTVGSDRREYAEAVMDTWEQIRHLVGRTLTTSDRGSPFTVDVVRDGYLVVLPDGRQPRLILRRAVDDAAALAAGNEELTLAQLRREFPKDRSLSYILAILQAVR